MSDSDRNYLPYGRHQIDDADIAAVVNVLRGDWLTTGPAIAELEHAFADFVGAEHCVAVSSGTAALHSALYSLDLAPGDEVIVPAITFVATANAVVLVGATPTFADVDPVTLLIDPESVRRQITHRTKAIVAVDYAGQPADYDRLWELSREFGLKIIADACHAPGATYQGKAVGTLADMSAFSLHPVKHFTGGEGGIVALKDQATAERLRRFRNHGLDTDHFGRERRGTFAYDMIELGLNYRLTDFQAALAQSQLTKLPQRLARRQELAVLYNEALAHLSWLEPLTTKPDRTHAWHLYVVKILDSSPGIRDTVFSELRRMNIGANVHYRPVYLHSYYRRRFGHREGLCPNAERLYEQILTLPLFPTMTNDDVSRVAEALTGLGRKQSKTA